MDWPEPPTHVNCRCHPKVKGWRDYYATMMRRTADVDPDLIRTAEIRALEQMS